MQRRYFLWLSVAGTTSLTLSTWSCSTDNGALHKALAQPEVLSRFCDAQTLKDIGKGYRNNVSAENNKDRLQDLLLSGSSGKAINRTADRATIQTALRNQIEEDFKAGRIIKIQGWVLSVTEVRQCALFSLI